MICNEVNDMIAGLTISSSNYVQAVLLLKERYGNKQLLVNTYMKMFVELQPVKNSNDALSLRKNFNKVESSVRNLKTLSVETDAYG